MHLRVFELVYTGGMNGESLSDMAKVSHSVQIPITIEDHHNVELVAVIPKMFVLSCMFSLFFSTSTAPTSPH